MIQIIKVFNDKDEEFPPVEDMRRVCKECLFDFLDENNIEVGDSNKLADEING